MSGPVRRFRLKEGTAFPSAAGSASTLEVRMHARTNRPLRRHVFALLSALLALAWAATAAAKEETGSATAGPPVSLSSEQRSKLAAKRLATLRGTPPSISVVKAPDIVTIGEPTGVTLKPAPAAAASTGPVPLDPATARALQLLRVTLPVDVLRALGLAKPVSGRTQGEGGTW
jgi:hypothetical protein